MVFKRRNKRSWGRILIESVWPRGGWTRAAYYVNHRLRRLPDAPHRIARGIFAGIFVSFTPFFGLHFLAGALLAWLLRGNILASLMATFVGNPVTFPVIAAASVELGNWVLGSPGTMSPIYIFSTFGHAGTEAWANIHALFTGEPMRWTSLISFMKTVGYAYLVGGTIWGIVAGLAGYYICLPLIRAYQNRRKKKLREKLEKRLAAREAEAATAINEAQPPGAGPS